MGGDLGGVTPILGGSPPILGRGEGLLTCPASKFGVEHPKSGGTYEGEGEGGVRVGGGTPKK